MSAIEKHIETLLAQHKRAMGEAEKWATASYLHQKSYQELADKLLEQIERLRRLSP